jgi:hypothetical protein
MPAEWEARVWGLVDQARRSAAILEVLEADRRHFNFLVRLRQLRKNCGKLIEYLVPALQLTTFFRVLHGLVSDESQFRLAVSEILKSDHVIRAIYDLMFYSIVRRLSTLFPFESEKYIEETIFSCGTISWYSPPFQNT